MYAEIKTVEWMAQTMLKFQSMDCSTKNAKSQKNISDIVSRLVAEYRIDTDASSNDVVHSLREKPWNVLFYQI